MILEFSAHKMGYNLQAGVVLQVGVVFQFGCDLQIEFAPQCYIVLQLESKNQK
jgi:hypothetical protein